MVYLIQECLAEISKAFQNLEYISIVPIVLYEQAQKLLATLVWNYDPPSHWLTHRGKV